MILEPHNGWRLQFAADYKTKALGQDIKEGSLSLGQSFSITRNSSVRITAKRLYRDGEYTSSADFGLYLYY